jgi:hypothetical protein
MNEKKYLKEPGQYEALIIAAEAGHSKNGDAMLTITFKDMKDGGEIRGYFVPKFPFLQERLAQLKLAVGVGPMAKKDEMLGKKLVIGVRMQQVKPGKEKINEKTGQPYPPSAEVFEFLPLQAPASYGSDDLPF